jgi:hypothetical protein
MSEPREAFIEELMTYILSLRKIPKVRVERVIGPILGFFIAELLSKKWGKQVEMICEEFPLRKLNLTYQSTNIDWLLYNRSDDQLVFLELKTACTSFAPNQKDTYCQLITEIEKRGSSFLFDDLKGITPRSREKEKYKEVLKRFPENSPYSNCKKAKVVYLAPAAMVRDAQHKPTDPEIEWLSFTDLPATINGRFAEEWEIIRRKLVEFDSKLPPDRTQGSGDRLNYRGPADDPSGREVCKP